MFAKIMSTLAIAAVAQASSLGEASRRLQGAADVCSPSDAELLTLIEIVLAQNEKLTQQTNMISCLTTCKVNLDADCDCASGVAPPPPTGPPPPPPTGPPPPTTNSAITIQVSSEYQATLGTDAAFEDCFLTMEEINSDPEAQAFAAAFIASTAAQLGVDPSTINIDGISTDGDNQPGCAGGSGATGSDMIIQVTPDFAATLGHPSAFLDCWLSPEEIASDPDAAAFAAAFIASSAASLGVDPSSIQIGGISTVGQTSPGCSATTSGAASEANFAVSDDFASAIGDSGGFDDCVLTADEIAADEEAQAMAQAFAQAQADALGVDVADITITGIEATEGQGCSQVPHAASTVSVGVTPDFLTSIAEPGFLDDCFISPEEIASNANAAALAQAFIATQAATLGVDPATINVSGISTDDDDTPGCQSGRRLQTAPQLKIAMSLADGTRLPKHLVSSFSIQK